MANPVVHFEVTGIDGKSLQDFYSGVFGWKINADNPMNYGIVDAGETGGGIGGGNSAGGGGTPPGTVFIAGGKSPGHPPQGGRKGGEKRPPRGAKPGMVVP